ncbi:hypothetical protein ACFX2C_027523 [Malus domestica]
MSFMDGFSGYNQIKMSAKDAKMMAFRTPLGNFYYIVIPFGLKNAGTTYQRPIMAIFHDMIRNERGRLCRQPRREIQNQEKALRSAEEMPSIWVKIKPKNASSVFPWASS